METSYRDILNQAYLDRHLVNPSYSMRSFARDLGIPPSTLSEVLNGKKGISPKRAAVFAEKLRFPAWQIQLFCDLASQQHAKSPRARIEASKRIVERAQENQVRAITDTTQRALTSWIDLAILELTYLKDFEPNSQWIAKKIGADLEAVENSVQRLLSVKLLEIDAESGKWKDTFPLLSSTDGIPSESIRRFHHSVLKLAQERLENTGVESRTVKSVVFSISNENMPRAKKVLDDAIAKIVSLADDSSQNRELVMCFSSQLFPLTQSATEAQ